MNRKNLYVRIVNKNNIRKRFGILKCIAILLDGKEDVLALFVLFFRLQRMLNIETALLLTFMYNPLKIPFNFGIIPNIFNIHHVAAFGCAEFDPLYHHHNHHQIQSSFNGYRF